MKGRFNRPEGVKIMYDFQKEVLSDLIKRNIIDLHSQEFIQFCHSNDFIAWRLREEILDFKKTEEGQRFIIKLINHTIPKTEHQKENLKTLKIETLLTELNIALLLDAVCHYKAYLQTAPTEDYENKATDVSALAEIEHELKKLFNEKIIEGANHNDGIL